jgi:hypothetical protein
MTNLILNNISFEKMYIFDECYYLYLYKTTFMIRWCHIKVALLSWGTKYDVLSVFKKKEYVKKKSAAYYKKARFAINYIL